MPVRERSATNRRRHSYGARVCLLKSLVISLTLLSVLTHCAHTPPADPQAVRESPATSAAVAPMAGESSAETAKLRRQVDSLSYTAGRLRSGMSGAVAEADRLRQQKSATEKELDGLWKMLTASQEEGRNMFLELEAAQEQARIAQEKSDALEIASIAKDIEVTELRNVNESLRAHIASLGLKNASLQKKLDDANKKAGLADYYNQLTWWVIGGLFVAGLLFLLLKAMPAIIHATKPTLLK